MTNLELERKMAYDIAKEDFKRLCHNWKEWYIVHISQQDAKYSKTCRECAVNAIMNIMDDIVTLRYK